MADQTELSERSHHELNVATGKLPKIWENIIYLHLVYVLQRKIYSLSFKTDHSLLL